MTAAGRLSTPRTAADDRVGRFVDALHRRRFTGDIEAGLGARIVGSTDNSIYEVMPAAILYPRVAQDVNRAVAALRDVPNSGLTLTARGGGTGTNGQSLNDGIVLDFSRHMNRIVELDAQRRCVTVEPGVVLGQLNDTLAAHGLFFPPTVSTANRATLGGMVATDASGKGSRRYGKTSDYIEAMDVVLSDGTDWTARAMTGDEAAAIASGEDMVAAIHREVLRVAIDHSDEIARVFPNMNPRADRLQSAGRVPTRRGRVFARQAAGRIRRHTGADHVGDAARAAEADAACAGGGALRHICRGSRARRDAAQCRSCRNRNPRRQDPRPLTAGHLVAGDRGGDRPTDHGTDQGTQFHRVGGG